MKLGIYLASDRTDLHFPPDNCQLLNIGFFITDSIFTFHGGERQNLSYLLQRLIFYKALLCTAFRLDGER